jgi:hypothetical protein
MLYQWYTNPECLVSQMNKFRMLAHNIFNIRFTGHYKNWKFSVQKLFIALLTNRIWGMTPRFLENFSVPLFYTPLWKEKWLKITFRNL